MSDVNAESIRDILSSNKKTPQSFSQILNDENINIESMNIDKYRMKVISMYIENKLEEIK
jgi:hypothetical protein